jgi:hypothetical protein
MAITQLTTDFAGQIGVMPRLVRCLSTDNYATVTAPGYIDSAQEFAGPIFPTDFIFMNYNTGTSFDIFIPSITDGVITLGPLIEQGGVILPVVSGDFANFSGTLGAIYDAGYSPTNAAKTKVVMANGAVTANNIPSYVDTAGTIGAGYTPSNSAKTDIVMVNGAVTVGEIAVYVDTAGTIGQDAATAINNGNIQAGSSGTAGKLMSYSSAAANGHLEVYATTNGGGNFTCGITNQIMGQSTVFSIPDPGVATSNFVVINAGLVVGNLVKATNVQGIIGDAGAALHSGITAAFAGGGVTNTYTATGLTAGSVGAAVIVASTNSVSICKAVPGTNTLAITFSADPGAATTVSYIYTTAAI